jgi:hypothetical protein
MSTSEARIEANRRNAQLSTGPHTPEGKAASSRNALSHGAYAADATIAALPNSPYPETLARYIATFQPATSQEALYYYDPATGPDPDLDRDRAACSLAYTLTSPRGLALLAHEAALDRRLHAALSALDRLQRQRRQSKPTRATRDEQPDRSARETNPTVPVRETNRSPTASGARPIPLACDTNPAPLVGDTNPTSLSGDTHPAATSRETNPTAPAQHMYPTARGADAHPSFPAPESNPTRPARSPLPRPAAPSTPTRDASMAASGDSPLVNIRDVAMDADHLAAFLLADPTRAIAATAHDPAPHGNRAKPSPHPCVSPPIGTNPPSRLQTRAQTH